MRCVTTVYRNLFTNCIYIEFAESIIKDAFSWLCFIAYTQRVYSTHDAINRHSSSNISSWRNCAWLYVAISSFAQRLKVLHSGWSSMEQRIANTAMHYVCGDINCYALLSENSQNFQKFNDSYCGKLKLQVNTYYISLL